MNYACILKCSGFKKVGKTISIAQQTAIAIGTLASSCNENKFLFFAVIGFDGLEQLLLYRTRVY